MIQWSHGIVSYRVEVPLWKAKEYRGRKKDEY